MKFLLTNLALGDWEGEHVRLDTYTDLAKPSRRERGSPALEEQHGPLGGNTIPLF